MHIMDNFITALADELSSLLLTFLMSNTATPEQLSFPHSLTPHSPGARQDASFSSGPDSGGVMSPDDGIAAIWTW